MHSKPPPPLLLVLMHSEQNTASVRSQQGQERYHISRQYLYHNKVRASILLVAGFSQFVNQKISKPNFPVQAIGANHSEASSNPRSHKKQKLFLPVRIDEENGWTLSCVTNHAVMGLFIHTRRAYLQCIAGLHLLNYYPPWRVRTGGCNVIVCLNTETLGLDTSASMVVIARYYVM